MKEITDIERNSGLIRDYIKKYGFMAEHKFEYFKALNDEGNPTFVYEDDFGVLCFTKKNKVKSLVEPLTKQDNIIQSLEKFIDYFLNIKKFDKVILETRHEIRQELIKKSNFRILKESYQLTWPVFIMKNFDENLSGIKWKKMRNFKNKFFKLYNPEVDNFKESDKEELKKLILTWKSKRTAHDRTDYKRYLNFIDNNFKGFEMVKVIRVNNKPVSVFGGWRIPNSNTYFSCIGIYDYDYENIGEVSNILDLTFIKKLNVEKADFGGGEESLTNFKKKFFPDEFYVTDIYSVMKNN